MKDLSIDRQSYLTAGTFTLALRLVVGWTYFSAFWRRVALENKLDPEAMGYIGEKFNHFLPNAFIIKPIIEYLVLNPDTLFWAMVLFTIIEGVVGLMLMLGLFTRAMSIGVFGLAMGILLGSGWIGTTCLDEWQIGILGIAAGFTMFLAGAGKYSLDYLLLKKKPELSDKKLFGILGSGALPIKPNLLQKIVFSGSMFILFMTLLTNQVFHGGVWGTLHNKSVRPIVEIADGSVADDLLSFQVYRIEGADVYGSFLIGIKLESEDKRTILNLDGNELSEFSQENIDNIHMAMVKPGAHSLIIPLGAKAILNIRNPELSNLPKGDYKLTLTDISGIEWTHKIRI